MTRVHIYCRVSTEKACEGKGYSQRIAPQLHLCRDYCTGKGYSVVGVYWDRANRSSDPASRPGFGKMLDRLQKGDLIVVYHRDRLGEGIALAVVERDLERSLGVLVENTQGAGNGSTPEDKLIRAVLDAVSEYEHSHIRRKIRDRIQLLKEQGKKYTSRVYGLTDRSGSLRKDQGEQRAIQRMQALRDAGVGPSEIAAKLTAEGVPTARGKRVWHHSSVSRILLRVGPQ